MFQLIACRVCLESNVRLFSIADTKLQEVYEKLTNCILQTDGKPLTVCYLCYSQLQTSQQLMLRALKAEELFSAGVQITPLDRQTHKLSNNLSVTRTENICTVPPIANSAIKEEVPEDCMQGWIKVEPFCEDAETLVKVEPECEYNECPREQVSMDDTLQNNGMDIPNP